MSTTAFTLPRFFAHTSLFGCPRQPRCVTSLTWFAQYRKRYQCNGPVLFRALCLPDVCKKLLFTVEHKNHTDAAVSQYPSASVSQPFTLLGSACISPSSPCGCFRKLA